MDLDLPALLSRYCLTPPGVIHVGAHVGDELDDYRRAGIRRQVWVEPQPEVFARLQERLAAEPDARAFNVACGEAPGHADMHLLAGNDGRSSSLLPAKLHLERFPEFTPAGTIRVPVVRLDDLLAEHRLAGADFPLLVLDVQGFELSVLRGAPEYLRTCNAIVSEVAAVELYRGGTLIADLDAFLRRAGFLRARTKWSAGCAGDAFYVRAARLPAITRLALRAIGGKGRRPPTRGSEVRPSGA